MKKNNWEVILRTPRLEKEEEVLEVLQVPEQSSLWRGSRWNSYFPKAHGGDHSEADTHTAVLWRTPHHRRWTSPEGNIPRLVFCMLLGVGGGNEGVKLSLGRRGWREGVFSSFFCVFFFSSPSYSNWQQVKYFFQAESVLLMIVIDKWSPCLYLQPMIFFMLFSLPVPFRRGNERADEWASGSQVRLASKLIKIAHMFVFLYIFP